MKKQENKECETRKKIASTLLHANEIMEGHGFVFCLRLADVLIARGIGDVSELKHRAKIVGRALHNACVNLNFCVFPPKYTYSYDSEMEELDDYCEYDRDDNDCDICREYYFLREAEKELEDRKDEVVQESEWGF